jgi:hypothetical protein
MTDVAVDNLYIVKNKNGFSKLEENI